MRCSFSFGSFAGTIGRWTAGSRKSTTIDPRTLAINAANRAVLHAKCVVVEEAELFVSSANFTEAAQVRNIEVGLFVRSTDLAQQVSRFYDGLIRGGYLRRIPFPKAL